MWNWVQSICNAIWLKQKYYMETGHCAYATDKEVRGELVLLFSFHLMNQVCTRKGRKTISCIESVWSNYSLWHFYMPFIGLTWRLYFVYFPIRGSRKTESASPTQMTILLWVFLGKCGYFPDMLWILILSTEALQGCNHQFQLPQWD